MIDAARKLWCLFVLFLAFGVANAGPPTVSYLPNGGRIVGGAITGSDQPYRALLGGGAIPPGSVVIAENASARVGSSNVPMLLKRTIPWNRVGDLAVRTLPVIAVGVALWDIWDNLRTKPDGSGGLAHDTGVVGTGNSEVCWTNDFGFVGHPGDTCFNGYAPAMEDVRSVLVAHGNASECVWVNSNAEPSGFSPSHGVGPPENYAQLLKCTGGFQGLSYWSVTATRRANVVGAVSCPAWVDFSNPALSGPAGAAPGLDGKCRTGRYDPISAQAAAALFDQYAPKTQAPTVVQDALGSGIDAQPYVSDEPGVASGPVTVTGAPTTTTTTGPTGAPTTTTSTPTQNVSYTNNQYTYNTTVVTVTNNNGDVTTTTTMQGEPAPEGKTDCDKYPDSIGCSKYGDPPSDAPIWKTQTIVYSEDALGLPSGCPPDRHFNFRGIDLQLRYQVLCDVAPTIKLALLALAALSCMFIVMQALKQ